METDESDHDASANPLIQPTLEETVLFCITALDTLALAEFEATEARRAMVGMSLMLETVIGALRHHLKGSAMLAAMERDIAGVDGGGEAPGAPPPPGGRPSLVSVPPTGE